MNFLSKIILYKKILSKNKKWILKNKLKKNE